MEESRSAGFGQEIIAGSSWLQSLYLSEKIGGGDKSSNFELTEPLQGFFELVIQAFELSAIEIGGGVH